MTRTELFILIERLDIPHYPISSIMNLLDSLVKSPDTTTTRCDSLIGYGTKELTRALLKRLEAKGLVSKRKNALNTYEWSVTELTKEILATPSQ